MIQQKPPGKNCTQWGNSIFLYDEDNSGETTPEQEFQERTKLNAFFDHVFLNTSRGAFHIDNK